jgi:methionyl-tRNA formyltransferase
VVFFGSGGLGVPMLEALGTRPDLLEVVGVVSGPDRPAGRGLATSPTPVARRAAELGLRLLRPATLRDPAVARAIAELRPDLGVLADYGRIVPRTVLAIPRLGILNVHPSILPRHRGATPIAATIAAGDDEAGVTVIVMDEGVDTGPVVALDRWPIGPSVDAPGLEAEAAARGAALLLDVLPGWLAGRRRAIPQAAAGITVTRPFRREDGRLDPALPAHELERRVRAMRPWPGSFIETSIGRLTVLEAATGPGQSDDRPATIVVDGDGLALATSSGRLRLVRVQPAGGRPMTGAELRRGRGRTLAGEVLDEVVARPAGGVVGESSA